MANMDLNPQEAAALSGLSERTLRAMLKDGRLPGRKKDGRWRIRQSDLPLTEAARQRLREKGDALRDAVERALPPGARTTGRSLVDVLAFRGALELRAALSLDAEVRAAKRRLDAGLIALAEGHYQYSPLGKIEALTRARGHFAAVAAHFAMAAPQSPAAGEWLVRLEVDVFPPLAGLLRQAETLAQGRSRGEPR